MNNSNNLVDDCDEKNPLGEGSFGIVYLCGNTEEEVNTYVVKDKKRYAVKFVKKQIEQNDNEMQMLEYLYYDSNGNKRAIAWTNENIVKYYKLKETELAKLTSFYRTHVSLTDRLYHILKFEYCAKNFFSFYTELKAPDEHLKFKFFDSIQDKKLRAKLDFRKQVFNGLYYLFERSIVHYDIKPENILVSLSSDNSPTYKIADFGASFIYQYDTIVPDITFGSLYYLPKSIEDNNYTFFPLYFTTFARDLYAFFKCLAICFKGVDDEDLFEKYLDFPIKLDKQIIKKSEVYKINRKPVNDIEEEEYINLYNRIKDDFDNVYEIRNSTIRHRGGSKKNKRIIRRNRSRKNILKLK
jgi:serine/threonine protein kinase